MKEFIDVYQLISGRQTYVNALILMTRVNSEKTEHNISLNYLSF